MVDKQFVLEQAAQIVAAYVGNNTTDPEAVPELIKSVFDTMEQLLEPDNTSNAEKPVPAIAPEKSVTDTHIICLEDGQKYKSLKRHLRTKHAMTPKAYTEKWGLPADYPMVAPNYSAQRSRLAKRTGLGKS